MSIEISVIIPTKNRARTIIECVNTVLDQSYKPAEVIVVDDNSTDETKSLILSHPDSRVKYFQLSDCSGAQAARNLGLMLAKSDWIAFQDSDDLWVRDKLERQVAALNQSGFHENLVVHGNGIRRVIESGSEEGISIPFTNGDCYSQLLISPAPFLQAMLVSKKLLMMVGGLDQLCPSHQEWDLSIRLAKFAHFIHLRESLFIWQRHKFETISADPNKSIAGYDYVIEKHRVEIIANHGERKWRQLKMANIVTAVKVGCYEQARLLLRCQNKNLSTLLIQIFIFLKAYPRGLGRLVAYLT